MLKIKIKATGQIIEVKDFSRIIIDEENEEIKDNRYWCSTRKGNKRNFVFDWFNGSWFNDGWFNGSWFNGSQDFDSWVRPVSNMKIR